VSPACPWPSWPSRRWWQIAPFRQSARNASKYQVFDKEFVVHNKLFLLDLGRMQMARSRFFGDLGENDPSGTEIVEFPISAYLIDGPEGCLRS
jgi:hypothetical protein